jgi:hypothetical protein
MHLRLRKLPIGVSITRGPSLFRAARRTILSAGLAVIIAGIRASVAHMSLGDPLVQQP